MTTKNCSNGPKLVRKDLCEKSFVRNVRLPFIHVQTGHLDWVLRVLPGVSLSGCTSPK